MRRLPRISKSYSMKTTKVFGDNYEAYRFDKHDLVINQGGQGSSKTWSILQLFYILALASKERQVFTICSYALPHLKLGAIRDLEKILLSFGENVDAIHNKTDHFYRIGNSIIDYFGIRDNYSKVTGPRRDFLFINEANNKVTYDDFDQLNQRTHKCTFLDYNPRSEFRVHDEVIPHFKHAFIKSTYLNNLENIPQSELDKILWKKDKPKFANWWRVYGLGELGQFEGVIFSNWRFGEFDSTLPFMFGLDFGFHPDPDAMEKVVVDRKHKKIYVDECFYKTEQTPGQLKENVGMYAQRNNLIIADSADPRLIRELSSDFNIRGISRRGTVAEWLRIMQDYEIIITERSHNLAKELNNYVWNDKRAGIPIDDFNHLIDGVRYCVMDSHQKTRGLKRMN